MSAEAPPTMPSAHLVSRQGAVLRVGARVAGVVLALHCVESAVELSRDAGASWSGQMLGVAIVVLMLGAALYTLSGRCSPILVWIVLAAAVATMFISRLDSAAVPDHFLSRLAIDAGVIAAVCLFDARFFWAMGIGALTLAIAGQPFDWHVVALLLVLVGGLSGLWAAMSAAFALAVDADKSSRAAYEERRLAESEDARLAAMADTRRVLHDIVIASLMVAAMADIGPSAQDVQRAARSGAQGLREGVTPWDQPR